MLGYSLRDSNHVKILMLRDKFQQNTLIVKILMLYMLIAITTEEVDCEQINVTISMFLHDNLEDEVFMEQCWVC